MKTKSGFTLIELMITLAVAIILVAVGIPAFNSMLANNRAASQVNRMVTAMHLARSEAVKRGLRVSLCSKANPSPTNFSCGGGGDWTNGWLVFTDAAGGTVGNYEPPGEELLRLWQAPPGGHTLSGAPGSITFLASGELNGAALAFTILFDKCTGNQNRTLNVYTTGRIDVTEAACP